MSKIHLVGIGGSGMLPLAELLLKRGYCVTGSDRLAADPAALEQLSPPIRHRLSRVRRLGAQFYPQDGSGIDRETQQVVVSTAIEADNPDKQKAEALGVPIVHRAQALGQQIRQERLIAVTGTSGKSTTAALLAWVLKALKALDAFVGGAEWRYGAAQDWSAVHVGQGEWCCLELDESDTSLLRFTPKHALILNIGRDHHSFDENLQLFKQFAERVSGCLFMNMDDLGCRRLAAELDVMPRVIGYQLTAAQNYQIGEEGIAFEWQGAGYGLPLYGRHNAENAVAALAVVHHLFPHVSIQLINEALGTFPGTRRRLQRYGAGEIAVYDDYAHNPEKLAALLTTLQERYCRVWLIFQPHGYGPLRFHFRELAEMFQSLLHEQDRLMLLPVYDAGGTTARDIASADLAEHIQHGQALAVNRRDEVVAVLQREAQPGDAIVTAGARDDTLAELAEQIASVLAD